MTQMVKKLPAVPETQVQSLGQEDPQEKGMATHSCILAWRIPGKAEPSGAMQETWVRSLGQEDPQEKEMSTHSSILAWEIPWTEKPGRLQSMGSQRVKTH